MPHPNILLFMTDSMDGRVMRHLGHPAAHTPNMDRLAALGTSFSNAYCNSPQCAPSRASFWSGQYVHRVQAWNNPGGLPMDAPTFGTHLENAGYGLHVFGKTDYRVGGHSLKARLTAWIRSANINRPHNPRPQATTYHPSPQSDPNSSPLLGERQVPASSAETGEGSSGRDLSPATDPLNPSPGGEGQGEGSSGQPAATSSTDPLPPSPLRERAGVRVAATPSTHAEVQQPNSADPRLNPSPGGEGQGEGSSARNLAPSNTPNHTKHEYLSPDQTPIRLHQKDWQQIDNTCQFLTNHTKDDPPYFLYPSTNVPHPPFRATQHWLDTIDPAAVTLPPYESDLHPVMDYMSVTKNTHGHFTDEEILAIRRHYFAMVAETDAMLGQVLDTLEATGQLHDTYIIFASDHGEMNMEHRQTLKNALYEASARVPLIVAGPGLRQGVISDELVSLIDLFPTFMDIAGLEHPEGLDGVSLLPLCQDLSTTPSVLEGAAALNPSPGGEGQGEPRLNPSPRGEGWGEGSSAQPPSVTQTSLRRGDATNRPNYVFSEYHSNFSNTGIAMWRQGPWKYIRYAGYPPQLFNLQDDPEEIHDLAQSHPHIVQDLDARLESLVDFDHADTQAKTNDRHNYQTWRQPLTPTEIQEALTKSHQGDWSAQDTHHLETWLADS